MCFFWRCIPQFPPFFCSTCSPPESMSSHHKGDPRDTHRKRSPVTDLYRAGVLRIVQQPHCAVAFPVQTPDAAAHQSAQHLLGGLRAGPQRRAYIQVWICCHVNDAPASALRSNTWSAAASVRSGGGGGASFVSSACERRGGGGWCVSPLGARGVSGKIVLLPALLLPLWSG